MTLIEMLIKNAETHPEKTALVYRETRLSYRDLAARSFALAKQLTDLGLKKGDRVGLLLQKTPEVIVSFLGAAAAGGIAFPVDSNQTLQHLQYLLNLTAPGAIIAAGSFLPLLEGLDLPLSKNKIIVAGGEPADAYAHWRDSARGEQYLGPEIGIGMDDVAYLNLTSGTTGVPKCAVTTYDNIYWNTRAAVENLELTPEDVHLCMFPVFSHPHELMARPLYLGGTMVLIDKISPKHIVQEINRRGVTCMMAIAAIYEALLRLKESASFELPSLRIPESGGMHVNPALAVQFQKEFNLSLIPVWGSTEATGIALASPLNGYRPGSMGRVCSYYEAKILTENGDEAPLGEIGEMIIRGPAVCSRYYNSPEETQKHMRDGWFHTGDMVKKDADGYFYFAGRKSGMMKVAGLKVYPIEIEDVLNTHPKVDQVAVVKAVDGLHGEVPRAVIIPRSGEALDKKEIRRFCEQRLSRYKVPRLIEFRKDFPRTSGGKILWREL